MKKLFAMIMALVLALGCTAALAEEAQVNTVNWADVESYVAELEGGFTALQDLGIQMWMPAVIAQTEVPADYAAQGMLYAFSTADGTAGFTVTLSVLNEGYTVDDFMAAMVESGATEVETGLINGIPCYTFDRADADASCVVYAFGENQVLTFTYAPMSDEGFKSTTMFMMSSVMPIAE